MTEPVPAEDSDVVLRIAKMYKWVGPRQLREIAEIMSVPELDLYRAYLVRLGRGERLPLLLVDPEMTERLWDEAD